MASTYFEFPNGPRNAGIWTRDLSISKPTLYHWANSPLLWFVVVTMVTTWKNIEAYCTLSKQHCGLRAFTILFQHKFCEERDWKKAKVDILRLDSNIKWGTSKNTFILHDVFVYKAGAFTYFFLYRWSSNKKKYYKNYNSMIFK